MTVLPIVARELRVTARRPGTYWSRVTVAALMLVVAGWLLLITAHQPAPTQAKTLFATLAGAALLVCGVAGATTTADSLSSEKREGTLGLLFLTPLRGFDVVLGKLCAGSVTVLYGLLAFTPVVALPILLGGITPGEFIRVALLLLNTMWLSINAAVFVSSLSRNEKTARAVAVLVMLFLAAGFPLLGVFCESELRWRNSAQWFLIFSPGYAFARVWDITLRTQWHGFWASMTTIHLCGWLFLGLACWITPRSWQDRPMRRKSNRSRPLVGFTLNNHGAEMAEVFRSRALGRNAFFWLCTRPSWRPWLVWGVMILLGAVWLGLIAKDKDFAEPAVMVMVALLWNGLLKAWVASEATRQLAMDRKSGSIELMLSTPLTDGDIARGQWLSLQRQFAGPLVVTALVELLLMLIGLAEIGRTREGSLWVLVWMCGLAVLFADVVALYAVGLWQSVAARGPAEAAGGTAFRILALPWILFGALGAAAAVADALRVFPPGLQEEFVWLAAWTLIALGVDAWFGLSSWTRFQRQFRQRAADRWRRRSFWSWLGLGARSAPNEVSP